MHVAEQSCPLAVRRAERERLLAKHPNTVPILLVDTSAASKRQVKYLALPPSSTVADVVASVRELCGAEKSAGNSCAGTLAVADGCVPAPRTALADLFAGCSNSEDGFLYLFYTAKKQSALGASIAGPCFAVVTGNGDEYLDNAWGGVAPPGTTPSR